MELRAQGPLELLDGALLLVRRARLEVLARAWIAGLPLGLLAIAVYYVERVEGIRTLRLPLACGLVAAWLFRAAWLSGVARGFALTLRPSLPVSEPPPSTFDVLSTASVVGFGLWFWLWPLAGMAMITPFAATGVWPFLALRGAVAPSWLARSACARERGLAAFGQAFDDTSGMRGVFLLVELLALVSAIVMFGNLFGLLALVLVLGHSLLGLDVAFVSSFLSPDNVFVLLALTAATLVALEPLRAAISAQAFVDARSRRDGADLHSAVDAALASAAPRRSALSRESAPPSAALWWIAFACAAAGAGSIARAQLEPTEQVAPEQTEAQPETPPEAELASTGDERVRGQVEEILARGEFREFADQGDHMLSDLFERFFRWLDKLFEDEPSESQRTSSFSLPKFSPWLLMAIALIALIVIAFLSFDRLNPRRAARPMPIEVESLSAAEPATLLDDAASLAARGDLRGAMRALYLSTLSSLDRGRLIEFEPWKTNGQYIRAMPRGEVRRLFSDFTRIFDHKWYGGEPTSHDDYAACRKLAEAIGAAVPP